MGTKSAFMHVNSIYHSRNKSVRNSLDYAKNKMVIHGNRFMGSNPALVKIVLSNSSNYTKDTCFGKKSQNYS